MATKQKYYVVWHGAEDGIFTSWEACRKSVEGFPGARYKSFKTHEEAEDAWENGEPVRTTAPKETEATRDSANSATSTASTTSTTSTMSKISTDSRMSIKQATAPLPSSAPLNDWNAIAVDAACSGNPGKMEYRGVHLRTGKEIFHSKVMWGTNNIGEFLAIVHGLALLKQKGLDTMPIYSDSVNAQLWVRKRKCKTTLERSAKTEELFQIIERAEAWLQKNTYANPIIKWQTDLWGEIPADFGRK